jgi:replicative DNA helicase
MASATEHAATVLSAILPLRGDLLDRAATQLTDEHFPDKVQKTLWSIIIRYKEFTGGVIQSKNLEDLLKGRSDAGTIQLYTETYETYASTNVPEDEFTWSVYQLRELAAERASREVLTTAMEILTQGKQIDTGEVLKGHQEARQFASESFSSIDKELTLQAAPEGAVQDETTEILADYAQQKSNRLQGIGTGVMFGIAELDRRVGGMQRGELILAAGYSSDGKTTLCTQTAWSAAIEQGKNVVFFTTETTRDQVRRKLVARHSKLPQFNLPSGLNTRDLKQGTLSEKDEGVLKEVVTDMTKNPAYGKLYIAQVPRGSTVVSLEQRMYRILRSFEIDLVVMDYLALLSPERGRQSTREELSSILKEAKLVATTFNNGKGVPFMSPWQVGRVHREQAEKLGEYTSAALSETAEATNSSDIIVALLAPTNNDQRTAEVSMQVLKNRDGETANNILVSVDYATSSFTSIRSAFGEARTTPGDSVIPASDTDYISDY